MTGFDLGLVAPKGSFMLYLCPLEGTCCFGAALCRVLEGSILLEDSGIFSLVLWAGAVGPIQVKGFNVTGTLGRRQECGS